MNVIKRAFLILMCLVSMNALASARIPIVYHPGYTISLGILEFPAMLMRDYFDVEKYDKVFKTLQKRLKLSSTQFYRPVGPVSYDELRKVHTQEYLQKMERSSRAVAHAIEVPAAGILPIRWFKKNILKPMQLATQGTLDAVDLAMEYGWAINLGGGYHHAKADSGDGNCIYADISLAAKRACAKYGKKKCLIIDLDAHQGNGHEESLKDDVRVDILDVYNGSPGFYPGDAYAGQFITYNCPVKSGIKDAEYLSLVRTQLPRAFNASQPDFIIYNAGTDILEGDPEGEMAVSRVGIIERDEIVFRMARERNIPIIMVPSGGYTKESATIIADSIINLVDKNIITRP